MSPLVGVVLVSVLGDIETPPGLPVLPAGVGVSTWAVFVGPSTVQMYVLAVKVEVSLLVDVGTSPGVPVLLPVVGVDVSTWVVSVFPSTVQVYMQSMPISTAIIHSTVRCYHIALDWNQLTLSFFVISSWTRTWCTTCCRNCSPISCRCRNSSWTPSATSS